MKNTGIFRIVIKKKTFDIVSADTGFYAYMGDGRLYYTFEKLILAQDRPMFYEYVKQLRADSFILHLNSIDNRPLPFYASLTPSTIQGQMHLTLIDIGTWIAQEKERNRQHLFLSKILKLYGDEAFIYDPQTRDISFLSGAILPREGSYMSLKDFEQFLLAYTTVSTRRDVDQFLHSLQNGARTFDLRLRDNTSSDAENESYLYLKCTSIFENGQRSYSVGFIRKCAEYPQGSIHRAELDPLTGVLNKISITNLATRLIDVEKRQNVSIAIVDVDYFKKVNDTYGHMIGDDTLKKVTSIMEGEVGESGVIGRIGGDEFFILFYDAYDLEDSRERVRSIKNMVSANFPPGKNGQPTITLSIGCAAYPKDADNYNDLFALADFAVYRAKEKGRNRYIIYDKNKHGTLDEIQNMSTHTSSINNREDMSLGDIMCVIMDRVYSPGHYPIEKLLDDFIENFEPERATIYNFERARIKYMVGAQVCSDAIKEETESYIHSDFFTAETMDGIVVVDDVARLERRDHIIYEQMRSQGICSCIHIKFWDMNGARCVLSLESLSKKITWNNDHMHYYRLLARLLSQYKIV